MDWHHIGAKPLSEPMLMCNIGKNEQFSIEILLIQENATESNMDSIALFI